MPTKEQILEAAATSPEAKQALEKLFPEYFEEELNLYKRTGIGDRSLFNVHGNASNSMIAIRDYKSFYLSNEFDWKLKDFGDFQTLVPTKK